ncbi:uncharacterized protein LOC124545968 [Schistocerca americana]|uniref:uncharacterized protein LOC124545968 n=1 Tax=Schistocerca americana TaxID=7009 RepID=UPI001F4FD36D|nr:uncharacterized protein LOC124545968 [Schistocerca americana]
MQFAVLLINVMWGAALAYPMKNKYGMQRINADYLDLRGTTMGGMQWLNADYLDLRGTTMGGMQRINADYLDLGGTTMGGIQRNNAHYSELEGTTNGDNPLSEEDFIAVVLVKLPISVQGKLIVIPKKKIEDILDASSGE